MIVVIFLEGGTPSTAVTPVEILSSAGYPSYSIDEIESANLMVVAAGGGNLDFPKVNR